MFGWIPFVLLLFAVLPPRRAILFAYLGAFLFLPNAAYQLQGLPDYTKMSSANLGALCGMILFDPSRLLKFRPHPADLPVALFCLTPFVSSVNNGLGIYDGLSVVLSRIILWGIPYLSGRTYFTNLQSLRELA